MSNIEVEFNAIKRKLKGVVYGSDNHVQQIFYALILIAEKLDQLNATIARGQKDERNN